MISNIRHSRHQVKINHDTEELLPHILTDITYNSDRTIRVIHDGSALSKDTISYIVNEVKQEDFRHFYFNRYEKLANIGIYNIITDMGEGYDHT